MTKSRPLCGHSFGSRDLSTTSGRLPCLSVYNIESFDVSYNLSLITVSFHLFISSYHPLTLSVNVSSPKVKISPRGPIQSSLYWSTVDLPFIFSCLFLLGFHCRTGLIPISTHSFPLSPLPILQSLLYLLLKCFQWYFRNQKYDSFYPSVTY